MVGTRSYLRNNYMYRMAAAVLGIYDNSKDEAVYPVYFVDASGEKMDGSHRYTLRYPAGQRLGFDGWSGTRGAIYLSGTHRPTRKCLKRMSV